MIRTAIGIVIAFLILYGAIEAYPLIRGPEIIIDIPIDYTTSPDGSILLSGTAKRTETLRLGDGILLIDEQGHFEEILVLPKGTSILVVTATDRFNRKETKERTVYVP